MTLAYDEVWTCTCGTENVGRLICSACNDLHPTGAILTPAAPLRTDGERRSRLRSGRSTERTRGPLARGAMALVVALVVLGGWSAYQGRGEGEGDERLDNFLLGTTGAEFVAPDLQFRATFPNMPARDVGTSLINGVEIPYTIYTSALGADAAFSVGALEVPADQPFDLNAGLNSAAARVGGEIVSASPASFLEQLAVEGVIAVEGRFIRSIYFHIGNRVFVIQVVGDEDPPKGFDEFTRSFSLLTAP